MAARPPGWHGWPNPYLAYWRANATQRVSFTCGLTLAESIHGWLGEDFAYVRSYRRDQVRDTLWPWVLERDYAEQRDEAEL